MLKQSVDIDEIKMAYRRELRSRLLSDPQADMLLSSVIIIAGMPSKQLLVP
jgi:hypothetical protein